ncbi:MAG TPA: Bax inhibitor-1 family protein [Gemmatimonadaceae bacterium]|nr:Bax inhibitor-1 family protein [Gemmatimonadaceae bacterium]
MGISYDPTADAGDDLSALPTGYTGAERATLVRRTYALVFLSVLVTIGGVGLGLGNAVVGAWVWDNFFVFFGITLAVLWVTSRAATQFPLNIALLCLFTFLEGVLISPAIRIYGGGDPAVVARAAGLTALTFIGLTFYAMVSRRDFSAWGAFLFTGLWVLLGTYLVSWYFSIPLPDLYLTIIGLVIFSGLLVYDTWRLRNEYGPDDYVHAAINIYLDLVGIFLRILRLLRRD